MTNWTPGPKSQQLFEQSLQRIPGGVNSPVRAFKSVGLSPFFVDHADGAYVYDADGNRYVDFMASWGPMILGHNHPAVNAAICAAVKKGVSFGASHKGEFELAERVCAMFPSIDKVRMVNSGTEATMSAVRLARGFTGRDKIIKFKGNYHGHADAFLIEAGSGAATLGQPSSPGIPAATAQSTLTADYNSLPSVDALIDAYPTDIAAIIVEPVAGNMGCVPPLPGFLEGLRKRCNDRNIVLILDEVITGFRLAKGGAQEYYHVDADLTTLGKVLGGGMPVGAFGGKKEIMDFIAPMGPVYQAGTLAGNPVAVASGIATLKALDETNPYEKLETLGATMEQMLQKAASDAALPLSVNRVGSMMGFFLTDKPVTNYQQAAAFSQVAFNALFESLLQSGVSIAPSGYESLFVGTAHDAAQIRGLQPAFTTAFSQAHKIIGSEVIDG